MSFLKSLFGLRDGSQKLADQAHELYPDPNANEAEYQKEALADLQRGIVPTGFTAQGYLCKKGEKVIYCFNNVTHYCSAVTRNGLAGVQEPRFASPKAFGFAREPIVVIAFSIHPWSNKVEDA
jgi:hypothetical protein